MADFKPKDIEGLEDIYYNTDRKKDKIKYQDFIKTNILSPNLEKDINKIFQDFSFKKIKERGIKTFDFKDDDKKILSEVTSIDFASDSNIDKLKPQSKIRKAIKHLGEKDSREFSEYNRGGIVYYSSTLALLGNDFVQNVQNKDFITTEMEKNNLDYLLITPTKSSVAGISSREILPSVLYVKKKIKVKFRNFSFNVKIEEFDCSK